MTAKNRKQSNRGLKLDARWQTQLVISQNGIFNNNSGLLLNFMAVTEARGSLGVCIFQGS